MAASSLFCPHCENRVEIQVAAVTLSRACPDCGQVLVLQVAERTGPMMRKALLVAPTSPVDEAAATDEPLGNGYEALPEDAFDRMRLDPALVVMRKRFFIGVAGVVGLIIVATVAHFLDFRQPADSVAPRRVAPSGSSDELRKIQHVQPAFAAINLEERLDRFKSAAEERDAARKAKQPVAPTFDSANETLPQRREDAAPPVFEVSDKPAVVTPPSL